MVKTKNEPFEVFFLEAHYSIFCKCNMPDRWGFNTARGHMNVFDTKAAAETAAALAKAAVI